MERQQNYKVLLVDDEEEIRMGICHKIEWEALGYTLIGMAENGVEALEMAEQLRPDVVLTDIKMPFMDGLELCRQLKSSLPAAKLVIFSGFDDFEYARQAVGMDIFEYILKPINAAELSEVLVRLRQTIDKQRAQQRDMELLQRKYEESLPQLRELFFTRLLDGSIKEEQVYERAARYEIELPPGQWAVAMLEAGESADESMPRGELLLFSVRSFVQEQFCPPKYHVKSFIYNDMIALVACLGEQGNIYSFIEKLGRVCDLSSCYIGVKLTVGVGRSCKGAHQLAQSARQACSALEYRVLMGSGRVIYLGDVEQSRSLRLDFDENDERGLAAVIKLGDAKQLSDYVAALMERINQVGMPLNQCHYFLLELAAALIRLARTVAVPLEDVFGAGFTGSVSITDFSSLEELRLWYEGCCLNLQYVLVRQRQDSAWDMVERAREYIQNGYANSEMNMDELCRYLHLSPAYFSTLFKRETGVGYAAYVTNTRIEAAKRLLRETEDKTYLIAEKVGYADPNYFSYVFKRQTGCSPSQYRSNPQ